MKNIEQILLLLNSCTQEECRTVYRVLRKTGLSIHPLEDKLNTTAEIILEAIDRASDLSLRGVRGLIAEATFEASILPQLPGWVMVPIEGDKSYDFLLRLSEDSVSIQVKLQRLEKQKPKMWRNRGSSGMTDMFVVETQKTRNGLDSETQQKTRPYRFGEFDILAVCMQPSTYKWDSFMFTVGRWLLPRPEDENLIQVFQPVAPSPNEDWTDDLKTCIEWLRSNRNKTISTADTRTHQITLDIF